jgi:hypothetical protein
MKVTAPRGRGSSRSIGRTAYARAGLTCAVLAVVGLATVIARGGNDAYTSFSRSDLGAIQTAYRLARPGQTISGLTGDALPLDYAQVGLNPQKSIHNSCANLRDAAECVLAAAPDYLIMTPSQENYGKFYYGQRPGWTGDLVTDLRNSGLYRIVFDQDGSQVLQKTILSP